MSAAAPVSDVPRRSQSAALLLVGLLVLAGSAFLIGIAAGVRGDDILLLALGIAIFFCGALPLLIDQFRPPSRRHLFITLLSLMYGVMFGLPVVTQYLLADRMMGINSGVPLLPNQIAEGQLVALGALFALYVGYALPFGPITARAFPKARRDWSPSVALAVACTMIPLGWIIYLGSIFGIISARLGSGFLGSISLSTFFGIALLAIVHQRHRSRLALMLMLVLIPPTMAFMFFTTSKERFFLPLIMVGLAYLVVHRRIPARWVAVGFGLFIFFYPVASAYRQEVVQGAGLMSILRDPVGSINELSQELEGYGFNDFIQDGFVRTTVRIDGLSIMSVIVRDTPAVVPHQGGWTLWYIPLAYIPRALWPGKPIFDMGQFVTDNYWGGPGIKSNTGPTWVGEFYMNFGLAGVAIGMAFLGVFFRILHETLFRRPTTIPLLLACVILLSVTIMKIETVLMTPINGFFFHCFPLLATHLFVRNLSPRQVSDDLSPPEAGSPAGLEPQPDLRI